MLPVIFLGPTLRLAEARAILEADYRPPAALADVWRAARFHPPAIGIIDGYFHSVPAVWHKEILWALREGIAVFGGASMGALRAAELNAFGMAGVGRIYEAYAAGELEDDDEVALAHAGAADGFRPASEPMVNVRATLDRAVRESIVPEATRRRLEAIAKSLYYPERIWPEVLCRAREQGVDEDALRGVEQWLPAHRVDQKRADAILLLEAVRDHVHAGRRSPAQFAFEDTVLWRTLMAREEAADDLGVIEELKLEPLLFDRILREAGESGAAMVAALQREGEYQRLLGASRRKREVPPGVSGDGPDRERLIHWFFETRLGGWPDDLPAFLRARGWFNEEILLEAASREYTAASLAENPAALRF